GVFSSIPARYMMACMCLIGITLQYAIKAFLSVAIVAMVKTDINASVPQYSYDEDTCPGEEVSSSESEEGEFDWSDMQGVILSSYYYGYIATQLLAGRLSEIFGSKRVLGPGLFISGLMTVLGPVAARTHVGFLIATRIIVGAASGLVIPAVNNLLPKWFVPQEISFIGGTIMAGIPVGIIISMILSGVLADAGGWPLVFYFFGGLTIIFMIPWLCLAFDCPEEHPTISEVEKDYILTGTGLGNKEYNNETKKSHPVPWFEILTSWPIWVHNIMGMGYAWVSFTLLNELPTYLSQILHYKIQENGLISSLPYVSSGIGVVVSSYLSQMLRRKGYISHLTAYWIFNSISGFGSGLCLLIITFSGCDKTVIVILLVCALGTAAFYQGGSFLNHVDLGRNYTGTIAGIYLTVYNAMGVIAPLIIDMIVDKPTLSRWKIVFYVGAAVPVACTILYLLFGTIQEQCWNKLCCETEQSKPESNKQAGAI
ncbi:hypothetical protein L9F63_002020, partial [Diploptera punctata]